jgi:hypothetical protein
MPRSQTPLKSALLSHPFTSLIYPSWRCTQRLISISGIDQGSADRSGLDISNRSEMENVVVVPFGGDIYPKVSSYNKVRDGGSRSLILKELT